MGAFFEKCLNHKCGCPAFGTASSSLRWDIYKFLFFVLYSSFSTTCSLFPNPYSLLLSPHRDTLNCAPANKISPETYAQNSSPTET